MGIGISVSVDSWAQQAIEDLTLSSIPITDSVYRRLISTSSVPAEIFVIDQDIFEKLMVSQIDNVNNILLVCLENLLNNDIKQQLIAAALLTRMFPFLCMEGYPIKFQDFILDTKKIFDIYTSPGGLIISICMEIITNIQSNDTDTIFQELEGNIVMFDLLILTVFSLMKFYNNFTLYHQIFVAASNHSSKIFEVLLNYAHAGGRAVSLICLITLLMFHPSHEYVKYAEAFIESGGYLSSELCRVTNDDSDLFCFICSLAFNEEILPILNTDNTAIIRLSLMKFMIYLSNINPHGATQADSTPTNTKINMNTNLKPSVVARTNKKSLVNIISPPPPNISNTDVYIDPNQLLTAYNKTKSPFVSAVLGQLQNFPPQHSNSPPPNVPIFQDYVFEKPADSEAFINWIIKNLPDMFLFYKNVLFQGTGIKFDNPNFENLDQFITTTV